MKVLISTTVATFLLLAIFAGSGEARGRRRVAKGRNATESEQKHDERGSNRQKKFFSMFQVVTFANDECEGDNDDRNGTCYTSQECSSRGGEEMGSCAEGFGVCCAFLPDCGDTSSQNLTYLVEDSANYADNGPSCSYTICRSGDDICRIRLDFTTLALAPPFEALVEDSGAADDNLGAVGDCLVDAFSVTSPGGIGSPVICGVNTGQHMYVDASEDGCHEVNIAIGASTSTIIRQWDIAVTQYACGSEMGGPPGCLQYFTGTDGRISSFNFPTSATELSSTTTHLSSQLYTICVRRESGYCSICYTNAIDGDDVPEDQGSFGLSLSSGTDPEASIGASCATDYVRIPGIYKPPLTAASEDVGRLCGRYFDVEEKSDPGITLCSDVRPFRILFRTDADEETDGTAGANGNEQEEAPGGTVGFSLYYQQQKC